MKMRKLLSILLVLALCASLLPLSTYAADGDFTDDDDIGDGYDPPWYCNEDHYPCTCTPPIAAVAGTLAPVLSPTERLLQTHTPLGSGYSDDGGQYIAYALKAGGTQLDSWDTDNNRSTFTFDQYGFLTGASFSSPDFKTNFTYLGGILTSGNLWDEQARSVLGYTADGSGVFTLTQKSLDSVNSSAAVGFDPNSWHAGEEPVNTFTEPDGSIIEYSNGDEKHFTYGSDGTYWITCYDKDGYILFDAKYNADGTLINVRIDKLSETLVDAAKDSDATNITIAAPADSGTIEKVPGASITLPSDTLGEIASQTGASLTISTAVADVTLPNGGLADLAQQGDVTVSTQQNGSALDVSITADGKPVESVPGGLTLTVPAQSAGTVATLINEDGTEKLIPSAAHGSQLYIPLEGSAAIELRDNSQSFTDIPADHSWQSEGVQWAAANGIITGDAASTAIELDAPLTRTEAASMFSDYADYLGIDFDPGTLSGAADGQITRQELANMLWRFSGRTNAMPGVSAWQLDQNALSWYTELMGGSSQSTDQALTCGEVFDALQAATAEAIATHGGLHLSGADIAQEIKDMISAQRDPDIAEEMMAYTRNNILIQAAQSMLAQANQLPQNVLQLLQ